MITLITGTLIQAATLENVINKSDLPVSIRTSVKREKDKTATITPKSEQKVSFYIGWEEKSGRKINEKIEIKVGGEPATNIINIQERSLWKKGKFGDVIRGEAADLPAFPVCYGDECAIAQLAYVLAVTAGFGIVLTIDIAKATIPKLVGRKIWLLQTKGNAQAIDLGKNDKFELIIEADGTARLQEYKK